MRSLSLSLPVAALIVAAFAAAPGGFDAGLPIVASYAGPMGCPRLDPPRPCIDPQPSRADPARQPFDSLSHTWLSDRLMLLYWRTGLAEDERAAWLLASAGVDSLIAEAHAARNSGVHGRYYQIAIDDAGADAERILRLFEAGLPAASSARAAVLLSLGEWMRRQQRVDMRVFMAHLNATRGLSTGSARQRVLADLLAVPALDGRQLAHGIRAIGSAANRAAARVDLLITAAAGRTLDADARAAYLLTVRSIPVRGQRDRALAALR